MPELQTSIRATRSYSSRPFLCTLDFRVQNRLWFGLSSTNDISVASLRDDRYLKITAARRTAVSKQHVFFSALIRTCPHDDDDVNICITEARRWQRPERHLKVAKDSYTFGATCIEYQAGDQDTKVKGHVHCSPYMVTAKASFQSTY